MKKKSREETDEIFTESDENFYFIAGYTPGGVPYGTTWEEAVREGLVEKKEIESRGDDDPF